jgi:flavodoxin
MRTLVIYDSKYGNTEKVAQAIGAAIDAQVSIVGDVNSSELKDFDLVIIGSPTHGGFPTEGIHNLAKDSNAVDGIRAAAFDTRTKTTIFGYAAPKIARNLKKNGANLLTTPEGFFVLGMEGPLMEDELERAAEWAKGLVNYE